MHYEGRPTSQNHYLYRTERVGRKVLKKYIGSDSSDVATLRHRLDRLTKLQEREHLEALRAEQQDTDWLSDHLDHLVAMLASWKVLREIWARRHAGNHDHNSVVGNLPAQKPIAKHQTIATMTKSNLPGLHAFNRLCRQADSGDPVAQQQLNELLAGSATMVSDAMDLTVLVQNQLIAFLGKDGEATRQILQQTIKQNTREARASLAGHPLGKLVADVYVLTWLDTLRSQVGAMRQFQSQALRFFWEKAKERSLRRFSHIQKLAGAILRQR